MTLEIQISILSSEYSAIFKAFFNSLYFELILKIECLEVNT